MQIQRLLTHRGMITAAFVFSGILTCAAVIFVQSDLSPSNMNTQVAKDRPQFVPIAPAPVITLAVPIPTDQVVEIDSRAPGGLATTTDSKLVINRALRDVCDYFLQTEKNDGNIDQFNRLLAYLKAKLPDAAYAEASDIAAHYAQYLATKKLEKNLKQHHSHSMPPSIPTPGEKADRLAARIMETSRLRQELLGMQVSKIWFGDEEKQALQYAEQLRTPKSSTALLQTADGISGDLHGE